MKHLAAGICITFAILSIASAQETRPAYKVTIKDGRAVVGEPIVAIDPTPRIRAQFTDMNAFGLAVEGKRITCSEQGSIWQSMMVDGAISNPFIEFGGLRKQQFPQPLPPTPSGRKRLGTHSTWIHEKVSVTQVIELVPSKPSAKAGPNQKRQLDTCRISYILENKDNRTRKVAFKTGIDILIDNNDGALYASPTTEPGKILNGVRFEGKQLPEWIWVLQQANLRNPGMVATMTFKHTKGENPNKVVLSNLGVVARFEVWDVPPLQAGDSACALFWEEKELKPGEKRELVWGYGGGISTSPEAEGLFKIGLTGSFEPGKLFTIAAQVEDPATDQTVILDLPDGIERVEGRQMQAVGTSPEHGSSMVLWKARVTRSGDFEIRVRSSTGTVQSKEVRIEKLN
jgi:hypothetical protein